jgi:phosphotransferase system IIB component
VLRVGDGVQIIYGPHVNKIKSDLDVYLESVA